MSITQSSVSNSPPPELDQLIEYTEKSIKKQAATIESLAADGHDLDGLAGRDEARGVLARQAGDVGIEATAQAALGCADDQQMRLVLARAGKELRGVVASFHRGGEISEHCRHALRIRASGDRRLLSAAQFRRRHHLHRLGDLARGFHRGYAVSEVF